MLPNSHAPSLVAASPTLTNATASPSTTPTTLPTAAQQGQEMASKPTLPKPFRSSAKRANSLSSDLDRERFRSRLNSNGMTNNTIINSQNNYTYNNPIKQKISNSISIPNNNSTTNSDKYNNEIYFSPFSNYFNNHKTAALTSKLISIDELCFFLSNHYLTDLPDVETMFPWLHGIHKDNIAQIRFMANTIQNSMDPNSQPDLKFDPPLSTRNLMVVRSSNLNGDIPSNYNNMIVETSGLIKGTITIDDILMPLPSISQIRRYIRSLLDDDIVQLIPFDLILKDCFNLKVLPIFKDLDPQIGVSLRNFNIQISKLSIISDFLIYCFNDDHQNCLHNNITTNVDITPSNSMMMSDINDIEIDIDAHPFNDGINPPYVNRSNTTSVSNCKCSSTARLLYIAQYIYAKNNQQLFKEFLPPTTINNDSSRLYNTYIVEELDLKKLEKSNLLSITTLDTDCSIKNFGDLCSDYDLKVFNNWDSNYLYREKLEIAKMSTATFLINDIWIGNTTDFECLQIQCNQQRQSNEKNNTTTYDYENEFDSTDYDNSTTPLHCDTKNTIVTLTKKDFLEPILETNNNKSMNASINKNNNFDEKLITFPKAKWRLFLNCAENARFPKLSDLQQLFELSVENDQSLEQIYLEFPPSGSFSMGDLAEDDLRSIINLCKLLYYKCSPKFPCLIYCSDGYTESSLLVLSFLIYSKNISIDEAIIQLHIDYGRPFFIFKSDYVILQKLQPLLQHYSPLSHESNKELVLEPIHSVILKSILFATNNSKNINQLDLKMDSVIKTSTGNHIIQLRDSGSINAMNNSMKNTFNDSKSNKLADQITSDSDSDSDSISTDNSSSGKQTPIPQIMATKLETNNPSNRNDIDEDDYTKLDCEGCCESVAGSLPSRILKGLYLGSLPHASSLRLLNKLGIRSLVSVGEHIPWLNHLKYETSVTKSGCEILSILPGQKDLDGVPCLVKEVMKISNINDDGIGTLTTTINDALEFIDKWYGLNSKVLVHCQVGVSRSATVCIAEVMKRLNISLPRAYLFVRVRRLNVIIQPNLKLMYELFKWEETFVKSKLKSMSHLNNLQMKLENKIKNSINDSDIKFSLSESSTSNSTSVSSLFSEKPISSYSFSSSMTSIGIGSSRNGSISQSPVGITTKDTKRISISFNSNTNSHSNPIPEEETDEDDHLNDDGVFIDDLDEDEMDQSNSHSQAQSQFQIPIRGHANSAAPIARNHKMSRHSSSSSTSTLKRPSFKTPFARALDITPSSSSSSINSDSFIPPTSVSFENSFSKSRKSMIEPNSGNFMNSSMTLSNGVSPKTSVDFSGATNRIDIGDDITEEDEEGDNEIGDSNIDLIISNSPNFQREVDWVILCREIHNLNKAYIKPVY